MNKRYQVFVSSTYRDLAEERMEVVKALLELDCIPCGMEYFPASSEDSWSYISDLIKQCDYYVLIVGGRYGSITKDGISFTQKEYECAVENGIPVLPFLFSDVESLPVKKVDKDALLRTKFNKFVEQVKDNNLCKEWHNLDGLGAVVSRGITQLIKRVPRTGWVRANECVEADVSQILSLTQQVVELKKKLESYEISSELADGDELIELAFSYSICYDKKEGDSRWTTPVVRFTKHDVVKISWNDVFSVISPRVSTGSSPEGVKKSIAERVAVDWKPPVAGPGDYIRNIALDDYVFDKIRVQLEALRLITVGREVCGQNQSKLVKWHLTEKGKRRMVELLAVKTTKRQLLKDETDS